MVTGHYDMNSVIKFPSLSERVLSERAVTTETRTAHMFPASMNKGVMADGVNPGVRMSLRPLPQL
jgi:hypothetical protein